MIVKGQKINDRYQIIRTIGEGGMANVYLAHDIILDRDVAVKVLRGDLAHDEKFVRRFQREAISASSLSHPNIVEMYDVGEDDGNYYIVMEYIDGKTLKNLIKKRGALTLPEVIDIMLQLTSAVMCAHDSYIIHRDIKPQNVLIKEDGTVKITDFGIAMALNSTELTQTNSVMGSVHYLPPEQANGNGATIKSDIYSLGILMFELLTGKLPFKGENAVEIAIKQMKEQIPRVTNYVESIPQSVENVIFKACAKNPKNRYDSVAQMHEDIKTCLNEERRNEPRVTYEYPEHEDLEETKVLPNIKEISKTKEEVLETPEAEDFLDTKRSKKLNIVLIVLASIIGVVLLSFSAFALFFAKKTEKEILIPDVSGLSIVDAEEKLKKEGLEVNVDYEEENSSTVAEGYVIKTTPQSGRSVTKYTKITLVVSSGESSFAIENYVGQLYSQVEGKLKAEGIKVEKTTKEVTDGSSENNIILEQDVLAGTKLKKGDTIKFVVADSTVEYPDFVEEQWSLDQIKQFCEDNNITLTVKYKETSDYPEGTVISQSRAAKTTVAKYATLIVILSKEPVKTPETKPSDTTTDTTQDTTKEES